MASPTVKQKETYLNKMGQAHFIQIAPDRYTLKQVLEEIETIFRLREFLPENTAIPALETASVGAG